MESSEPQSPASAPPAPIGPIEAVIGVITRPVPTLRQIALARPWLTALAVYIVISIVGSLGNLNTPEPTAADLASLPAEYEPLMRQYYASVRSPLLLILNALFFGPLLLLIACGLLYLIGRMLGGRGPFSGLFSAYAYASAPSLPLGLGVVLLNLAGSALSSLTALLLFGVLIWQIVLGTIAIRESLNLSTGRAIATVLIPLGVLMLLACVLIFVAAVLLVAATTSSR